MKNIKSWKILKSELAFDHKWFKVRKDTVELPNGKVLDDYFYSEGGEVAMVFALTATKKVIWVRQYKHGAKQVVLELPAGFVDTGESVEASAKRELLEETGYEASNLVSLGSVFNSPSKTTLKVHFFFAKNVILKQAQTFDDNEEIEVVELSSEEIVDKITRGEICAADSVACVFLALNYLKQNIF